MKPICSFQYYDKKGRRLAVFCRFIAPTEAELFILACSLEDNFSRKEAYLVYEAYIKGGLAGLKNEYHPLIQLVTIEPEEGEIQTIRRYCQEHYYVITMAELEVPVLVNLKQMNELSFTL